MRKSVYLAAAILAVSSVFGILSCSNGAQEIIKEIEKATVLPVSITYKMVNGEALITLSTATDGAAIYYTTDGSNPSKSSVLYDKAFLVKNNTVVKAFACKNGIADSAINTLKVMEYSITTAPQGYVITENIAVDGMVYDKTSEIVVLPYSDGAKTITSTDESAYPYIESSLLGSYFEDRQFGSGSSVTINPFVLGQYEVTRKFFKGIMGEDPSYYQGKKTVSRDGEDYTVDYGAYNGGTEGLMPVDNVSQFMIIAFCNKLSIMSGYDPVYSYKPNGTDELDWISLSFDTLKNNYSDGSKESDDTYKICNVSVDLTKNGFRLPTLAEREFAARGGNENIPEWKYAFSGIDCTNCLFLTTSSYNSLLAEQKELYYDGKLIKDNNLDEVAWNRNNSKVYFKTNKSNVTIPQFYPRQVGLLKANRLGLYDMTGNAGETVFKIMDSGKLYSDVVTAGGNIDDLVVYYCSNGRTGFASKNAGANIGFRLCRTITAE